MRSLPLAKILPETAEGLLDHMAELFPEPIGNPKWDAEEVRWKLAQRAAYLQVRRQYDALKKRS